MKTLEEVLDAVYYSGFDAKAFAEIIRKVQSALEDSLMDVEVSSEQQNTLEKLADVAGDVEFFHDENKN